MYKIFFPLILFSLSTSIFADFGGSTRNFFCSSDDGTISFLAVLLALIYLLPSPIIVLGALIFSSKKLVKQKDMSVSEIFLYLSIVCGAILIIAFSTGYIKLGIGTIKRILSCF